VALCTSDTSKRLLNRSSVVVECGHVWGKNTVTVLEQTAQECLKLVN